VKKIGKIDQYLAKIWKSTIAYFLAHLVYVMYWNWCWHWGKTFWCGCYLAKMHENWSVVFPVCQT